MEFQAKNCYIMKMDKLTASSTAEHIRTLARTYQVTYSEGPNDRLAHHMSRLAGDMVEFDEIEQLLIGLQRANRITRIEMIQLQARYLHEAKL
ncbi:hypothetical protein [Bradyrhizobium prioriisuperbiae]|uniref:hypothetical protein n=1 Tax=Bradyrhizobium prioriisuperbiae TaxID=2854389 RepID=UPI0028E543C5|nr:hypothetical protein [Bradyrhizobium prioritasuperba]